MAENENKYERKHLITPDEFRALARPSSEHLDDDEVNAFITECEDRFIIPPLGYANYKACVTDSPFASTFDDTFKPVTLITGGEWKQKQKCGCDAGKEILMYCCGLKKALAYFVYAKMLRSDGSIVERAGFMQHRDAYADHVNDSSKAQYNDVMGMAEKYLSDCMLYAKYHTVDKTIKPVRGSRASITAIGD